jgi:hypothetical protein
MRPGDVVADRYVVETVAGSGGVAVVYRLCAAMTPSGSMSRTDSRRPCSVMADGILAAHRF